MRVLRYASHPFFFNRDLLSTFPPRESPWLGSTWALTLQIHQKKKKPIFSLFHTSAQPHTYSLLSFFPENLVLVLNDGGHHRGYICTDREEDTNMHHSIDVTQFMGDSISTYLPRSKLVTTKALAERHGCFDEPRRW